MARPELSARFTETASLALVVLLAPMQPALTALVRVPVGSNSNPTTRLMRDSRRRRSLEPAACRALVGVEPNRPTVSNPYGHPRELVARLNPMT